MAPRQLLILWSDLNDASTIIDMGLNVLTKLRYQHLNTSKSMISVGAAAILIQLNYMKDNQHKLTRYE
jgi:hypothetical protein